MRIDLLERRPPRQFRRFDTVTTVWEKAVYCALVSRRNPAIDVAPGDEHGVAHTRLRNPFAGTAACLRGRGRCALLVSALSNAACEKKSLGAARSRGCQRPALAIFISENTVLLVFRPPRFAAWDLGHELSGVHA